MQQSRSGMIENDRAFAIHAYNLSVPDDAVLGYKFVFLKCFTSPVSQVMESVADLIRKPYG